MPKSVKMYLEDREKTFLSESIEKIFTINVPNSVISHFWEECPDNTTEEFWAYKSKPNAKVGQKIQFLHKDKPIASAEVSRIEEPNKSSCSTTGKFQNHWKVFWTVNSFLDERITEDVELGEYKVPKNVADNARLGLELRKKFKRGGTDVGLETARRLANKKFIRYKYKHGIKHISEYFPRHEVDKKVGKRGGWGDRENPSAGWIANMLWGGDAGRDWSTNIVKKVKGNKKNENN